ncbi:phosphate/phosphite/phosphonate ABC transporter substrate-binding protein [Lysobacter sp. CFH 32150]|uniref:phosphate/phosphite/phosphonate ABC transporter substrate-binding protein n=1 Tax=Lysobacter sp. CFH 32150 TaxID=2927128 RepID=UPI001FA6EF07|nr:phosphate/phosphite/phosphonate ABC transporter substrate-binding protein [Lysobacter sp. CFH 32150]MCI4566904.1 phosphate/phosphite/phosphonate ABC transporter substrate-binding protein [Lysobacter sp. CFH 32150]
MLVLAAATIAALAPTPLQAATADDSNVLVIGRISDDPKAHYEQLKPLLDYVVPRMANVGIREGRILMARDAQQMNSYLRRGRVDWVTETAGTAMLLQKGSGARPLLLTERDGVSRYRTVFFARRDSGIRSLADLRGRSVAFQNPLSTSAYYVPASELIGAGLTLEILLSPMDRPASGSVGYLFARSELNIATWVHKRLVDVGVMSNLDWQNPQRVPLAFRRDFILIRETPDYPRALEMVRGNLDPKVEARLRQVLIEAANDPDAREALLRFFKTTRFLPIDTTARHALEHIGKGVQRVHAEVE